MSLASAAAGTDDGGEPAAPAQPPAEPLPHGPG